MFAIIEYDCPNKITLITLNLLHDEAVAAERSGMTLIKAPLDYTMILPESKMRRTQTDNFSGRLFL